VLCGGAQADVVSLGLSPPPHPRCLGSGGDLKRAFLHLILGSTQDPYPILFTFVPPVWAVSMDIPAAVPDLLERDLLQLVALGPLQKCFAPLLLSWPTCSESTSVRLSFSVHQDQLFRVD